jgi:hypothetical protein
MSVIPQTPRASGAPALDPLGTLSGSQIPHLLTSPLTTNPGRFAPITCSPRKVSRFAPLNRYYIIIDEVFFDNFWVIIYLFVVCKKIIIIHSFWSTLIIYLLVVYKKNNNSFILVSGILLNTKGRIFF